MSGERSFLNLFLASRTLLDSIRDKLVTLILFCYCSMPECWDDMVQCELCEERLHMSCEGFKTDERSRSHATNTISAWNFLMVESGKIIFQSYFLETWRS